MPLISVIIPYYNRKNTIKRAINSVLEQTFKDFEIVVVDDNSKTEDWNYLSNLQSAKINVIKNTRRKGAQGARNTGILAAKGDWIAFLDSDDEWVRDKLELQISLIESSTTTNPLFIHGNCITSSRGITGEFEIPRQHGEKPYKQILEHSGPFFQSMLVKKSSLEEIGLLDEYTPSYQEWETAIRLSKICTFIHIDKPLFIYHFHDEATISKDRTKQIEGYKYIINKYSEDIKSLAGFDAWNFHIRQIIKLLMLNGNWADAKSSVQQLHSGYFLKFFLRLIICIRIKPTIIENFKRPKLLSIIKSPFRKVS